ncbi:GlsB/YeaQ/YmgE family stress response membrane protein [Janibacter terrae]|uniref:GlsB/YeaQ/YmgE family stress response membrane protein n=1 Tax=Janibacter terrae TaxID=103817 RepID=UPI0031F73319
MLWTIIVTIIVGAIIGALARLVLPGRQNISTLVTVILGIVGALIGSWAYTALSGNDNTSGIDWIAFILGVIAAAILIVIYGMVVGRKQV